MTSLARKIDRSQRMVHGLVAKQALELAYSAYEVLALGSNDWYAANRNPNPWVRKWWKHFVQAAREQMIDLMVAPGTTQDVRDEIEEALHRDLALNPPVIQAEEVSGLHKAVSAAQTARLCLN